MQCKKSILIFLFSSFTIIAKTQIPTKVELGVQYTPALSNIYGQPHLTGFDHTFTNSGGITVNILVDRFIIGTGILHQTQGAQIDFIETIPKPPDGTGTMGKSRTTFSQIIIPAVMNYTFLTGSKVDMYAGAGLYFGATYRELIVSNGVFTESRLDNRFNPIFYAAYTAGFGTRIKLNQRLNLNLRSNLVNQISDIGVSFSSHAYSMGLDVGFNYLIIESKKTPHLNF